MKRVMVIGCPGSGKSTLSMALGKRTGLPLYHLDLLFWNEDGTAVNKGVFRQRLEAVLQEDAWILDGNYGGTMELRMAACDTVIFLDYPTEVCLAGVRERRGKSRPDLPWVETAEDEAFMEFIRRYSEERRPKVMALLQQYSDKTVVILKDRREGDEFLRRLR